MAAWYYDYGRTRPSGANRAHDILEGMFNVAVKWGRLPGDWKNPCDGLPAFKRKKIGKMLTREKLSRLGKVLGSIKHRNSRGAINAGALA